MLGNGLEAYQVGLHGIKTAIPWVAMVLTAFGPVGAFLPVTGPQVDFETHKLDVGNADAGLPTLQEFRMELSHSDAGAIVGVYVPGVLAMDVVQQPYSNPGFVSQLPGAATQFRLASNYGTLGFLAHNTVSGDEFYDMAVDQRVYVIRGDGSFEVYIVQAIRSFQALQPWSPYSSFKDLDSAGSPLTSTDLFYETYGVAGRVVFQTCIERESNASWGRLFVIATPLADSLAAIRLAPPGGTKLGTALFQ